MFDKLKSQIERGISRLNMFGSDSDVASEGLSIQTLVNLLETNFIKVMNRDSYDDQLLYDCSFLILMRPEDYHRLEVRLPQIVEGVVRRFYAVINKKKSKYSNYQPLGNYWHFHFCPQETDLDKAEIEEGKIIIISTATSLKQEWGETLENNELTSSLMSVSINGKTSKYSKYDLNMDALGSVDILAKGRMRLKFNPELIFKTDDFDKKEEKKIDAFAILSFEQNKTKKSYNMIRNTVDIGMATEAQEVSTTGRLNIWMPDAPLVRDHFRIKYDEETRIFYIALFAPARINEEKFSESVDLDNPVWHRLKQKSSILCGLLQINFEALK